VQDDILFLSLQSVILNNSKPQLAYEASKFSFCLLLFLSHLFSKLQLHCRPRPFESKVHYYTFAKVTIVVLGHSNFTMRTSIIVAASTATIFASAIDIPGNNEPMPHITLPYRTPISIGEVVYPSSQDIAPHLIAWLPTSHPCTMSTAITESTPFSIGESDPVAPRIDDLVFTWGFGGGRKTKDEWGTIERKGEDGELKKFAACSITPTSALVEKCEGGAEIWRTWTCFVDEVTEKPHDEREREKPFAADREKKEGIASQKQKKLEGDEEQKKDGDMPVPKNVAEPPPEFAGQGGTYQKWFCDEKGCRSQEGEV
jgi:hypothetical protein